MIDNANRRTSNTILSTIVDASIVVIRIGAIINGSVATIMSGMMWLSCSRGRSGGLLLVFILVDSRPIRRIDRTRWRRIAKYARHRVDRIDRFQALQVRRIVSLTAIGRRRRLYCSSRVLSIRVVGDTCRRLYRCRCRCCWPRLTCDYESDCWWFVFVSRCKLVWWLFWYGACLCRCLFCYSFKLLVYLGL